MIIDARSGARGQLRNLDTGEIIRCARWANLETGEFEAFVFPIVRGSDGRAPLYRGRARLEWHGTAPIIPIDAEFLEHPHVAFNTSKPISLCEHPSCEREAEYFTVDEEPRAPEFAGGRLFERAVAVRRRRWCPWHYQAARLVVGTEVIKTYDEVKVRPS